MKKVKNIGRIAFLMLLFLASISVNAQTAGDDYAPVVKELDSIYHANDAFKLVIDNALSSAISPLDGWSQDPSHPGKLFIWSEKDFTGLLDFFQTWLSFVPDDKNGMSYYEILYGLCYENVNALKFVTEEPGLSWTKNYVDARGDYMDSTASIDDHMVTMEAWFLSMGDSWNDFEAPHPVSEGYKGYTTFNEFFTRNIKEGKRPVSDIGVANVLVAPADGNVNVINENLNTNSKIHTKYNEYLNVDQLLDGSEYASFFIGGTATSTVLLPPNYHHYHSPAAGVVVESKDVDSEHGVYFGMDGQFFTYGNNGNVGGYMSDYGVFGVYHRGYYIIKTEKFGFIAMIAIGLDDISSINFEDDFKPAAIAKQQAPVEKGQKIGHFAYGGSTVILLFQPGVLEGVKLKQGAQVSIINDLPKSDKQ